MNISPINNAFSIKSYAKNNSQNTNFKGVKVNAAVQELGTTLPTTNIGATRIWKKLFRAIQEEPNLQVVDKQIFNHIKDHSNYPPILLISENNIDKLGQYVKTIAKDENGALLVAGTDDDGPYLQVNTNEGFRKFGVTHCDRAGNRYSFYKLDDVYLDFHHYGKEYVRTSRTKALGGENTIHFDENGESTVSSNVKGFFDDMLNTFSSIFK